MLNARYIFRWKRKQFQFKGTVDRATMSNIEFTTVSVYQISTTAWKLIGFISIPVATRKCASTEIVLERGSLLLP